MKVAIQGELASYHSQAAEEFFGTDLDLVCCKNFKDTFAALETKKADRAVIAIENSLYGSINEVYDLLLSHQTWIEGEIYLRVSHCLLGMPGAHLSDITAVHSQAEALAQCEAYLDRNLPNADRFEEYDTAGSVLILKERGDKRAAAIASDQAGKMYGLAVLARGIETHHQNYTRFVVISRDRHLPAKATKTSLVITMPTDTQSGSLQFALQVFAAKKINLTMLQSRPISGKAWHYLFYIDVEAGLTDKHFVSALAKIEDQGCQVNILGTYASTKP